MYVLYVQYTYVTYILYVIHTLDFTEALGLDAARSVGWQCG